jgi:class 3 adenylate cyclase
VNPHVEPEWELLTVMFADIRGYTRFADRATAREAAGFLRRFFDAVIPIVRENAGEINQLLGDGLLAVFRTPDHADRALASGAAMIDAAPCRIGVGLNSGLVLAGTIGGGGVSHAGVVGDPVNVAARVQDATRELEEPLLLTEATHLLLESEYALVPRGTVALKGKPAPIAVYGLAVTLSGCGERTKARDVGTQ